MKSVLSELDKIKVLDKDDIVNIKSYIQKKYPENVAKENSIILSHAINKIIYKELEGLPEHLKSSVKNNIIKNTLGKDKMSITFCDIFEAYTTEEDIVKNYAEELIDWINLNAKIEISTEDVHKYLGSIGFKDIDLSTSTNEELHFKDESNIDDGIEEFKDESNMDGSIEEIKDESDIDDSIEEFKAESNADDSIEKLENPQNREWKKTLSNNLSHSKNLKKVACIAITAIFIIPLYNVIRGSYFNRSVEQEKIENYVVKSDKKEEISTEYPNLHLPKYMRYEEINKEKLIDFLNKRNSLLAEEPYFSTIFYVAKEFNLNPIVLFSITGQEQSFVPKSHKDAYKIANNPFNVYYSWIEYNTDINDATRIASRTVINLSENRPEDKDPFLWIGRKYAEDKNWGKGVRLIFEELMKYVE
ncbi:hypothetical protein KQI86_02740 [Clostridium sp. MSJ-11]|uniref:Mannosyl-glycoprotein endo-beta-N-acetylglucosaminidase n=1 Tax=Clostridium mobile TaxID=2841512 RepID=A0ABS6EDF5_9CLOT|nr:hypothetical protein [Clostridium mobile]MBU5483228.1 hypothetical protein [Clostridium mobile]